ELMPPPPKNAVGAWEELAGRFITGMYSAISAIIPRAPPEAGPPSNEGRGWPMSEQVEPPIPLSGFVANETMLPSGWAKKVTFRAPTSSRQKRWLARIPTGVTTPPL